MKSAEDVSAEGIQWKLDVCPECGQRRMMPAVNEVCLECEREQRDTVLSAEDIRWVVSYRGPESFVRAAWMLASEDTSAATGIDVRTGMVVVQRWGAGEKMPKEEMENVIVLAVCPASQRAELPGFLVEGSEGLLSPEAAEELAVEVVVRSALADGGQEFWAGVDKQLRERSRLYESDVRRGDSCI